jgi:hypothetical protein
MTGAALFGGLFGFSYREYIYSEFRTDLAADVAAVAQAGVFNLDHVIALTINLLGTAE